MSMGYTKAKVFPDPVGAFAKHSRPWKTVMRKQSKG